MRATIADAIEVLRERVPPTFETQVRDFLAVHMKGGQAVPALRDADHRGQGRRVRDVVLPRLPALSDAAQGSLSTWPDAQAARVLDVVELGQHLPRRAVLAGDPAQGVAAPDLVGRRARGRRCGSGRGLAVGRVGAARAVGSTSVGTRVRVGVSGSSRRPRRLRAAVGCGGVPADAGSPGRPAAAPRGDDDARRRRPSTRRGRLADDAARAGTTIARRPWSRTMRAPVRRPSGAIARRTRSRRAAGRCGAGSRSPVAGSDGGGRGAGRCCSRRARSTRHSRRCLSAARMAGGDDGVAAMIARRASTTRQRPSPPAGTDRPQPYPARSDGAADPGTRDVRHPSERIPARGTQSDAVSVSPRKRKNPGDDLFSRKAALSVSSALESLTSVFGMGTGMASPLESPGFVASGRVGSGTRGSASGPGGRRKRSSISWMSRQGSITIPATDPWSVAEEVKPSTVSTAQLHPSPDFHMRPIKQVVSLRSYPVDPVGNLISRRASHLDAFSAYPDRT